MVPPTQSTLNDRTLTAQEWLEFMRSKKVPQADIKAAPKLHWQMVRSRATWAEQDAALAEHGVDTFGALAVRQGIRWGKLGESELLDDMVLW